MSKDLNKLEIQTDCSPEPLTDNSAASPDGSVRVHFRDLEEALIANIRKARVVVGCVAWLTSRPILNALASVPNGVSIVVQKEDFLRPDLDTTGSMAWSLSVLYSKLPGTSGRYSFPGLVSSLSYCSDNTIAPVRCVGNHNREKSSSFPRMHNKFVLFCNVKEAEGDGFSEITPYAVWTGSFNFSKNATFSFENAVVLTDEAIVQSYYREWGQILALSEPLNWEDPWCAPEWRIGS
jgi:hypothetical protein